MNLTKYNFIHFIYQYLFKYCIAAIVVGPLSLQTISAQKYSFVSVSFKPSVKQGTVKELIEDVSTRSGFIIEYSSQFLDTAKLIRLSGEENNLGSVLQKILSGQKVTAIERNNKIILVPSLRPLPENSFSTLYSIYGIVKESVSKEPLLGVTIIDRQYKKGTISNNHGYFTFLLPEGKQTIQISYIGYQTSNLEIDITKNTRLDIELVPATESSPEVSVITTINDTKTDGSNKVVIDDHGEAFSNILGEDDPLRLLYQFPGINAQPESAGSLLIRGGSPDQNVFLLDGNPIFNPTHILGSLSIVNTTSLKSLRLFKSDFPSRYGGGLSSVIDVFTKDGNMNVWKGEANASFLAGSLTVEGPLQKEKTAVMISARKSWVNPFLNFLQKDYFVNFYDVNFKMTHLLSKKDKLLFTFYSGQDKLIQKSDNTNNQQKWGNRVYAMGWNHLLKSKSFINTSFNFTSYNNIAGFKLILYDTNNAPVKNIVYNNFSSMQQFNIQSHLEYSLSNTIKITSGVKFSSTLIQPYNTNISKDFVDDPESYTPFGNLVSKEYVAFAEADIKTGKRLFIRPGFHTSFYQFPGYDFFSPQPRLFVSYKLAKKHQVYVSLDYLTQFLHLLTNPTLGINGDVWVPSTSNLAPEQSYLLNAGYTFHNRNRGILIDAQLYWKAMSNVTNYAEGRNIFFNKIDWESNIESGKGWAYGAELKMQKLTNKFMVNISYALAWSWRQFDQINNGNKFPFKYDRRHTLNLAVSYILNKKFNLSGIWNFSTGDVFNLPESLYADFNSAQQIQNPATPDEYQFIYHFSGTNKYRTLPYNRFDLASAYTHRLSKKIKAKLTFGVYNVSGEPSQYLYNLEGTIGNNTLITVTKYKLFNITPYLSYSVIF